MAYDYVRRTYGVEPVVGAAVRHVVTKREGVIAREDKGQGHYVMVRFEGKRFSLPCHPTELNYSPEAPTLPSVHGGRGISHRRPRHDR